MLRNVSTRQDEITLRWMKAAEEGDLATMQQLLLSNNGIDIEAKDHLGKTALHQACCSDHLNVVQYLIENGGAKVEATVNFGKTALHFACCRGHLSIVQYLMEKGGANVEATDHLGNPALYFACINGHLDIVQYLMEKCGATVEATDDDGTTVFHDACLFGQLSIIQYLIEKGGVNVEATDHVGTTALRFACSSGSLNVVQYLIEKCGAKVEATNHLGKTALHFACFNGDLNVVQYLIEKCGANVEATDNFGEGVFQYSRSEEIKQYLSKWLLPFADGSMDVHHEHVHDGSSLESGSSLEIEYTTPQQQQQNEDDQVLGVTLKVPDSVTHPGIQDIQHQYVVPSPVNIATDALLSIKNDRTSELEQELRQVKTQIMELQQNKIIQEQQNQILLQRNQILILQSQLQQQSYVNPTSFGNQIIVPPPFFEAPMYSQQHMFPAAPPRVECGKKRSLPYNCCEGRQNHSKLGIIGRPRHSLDCPAMKERATKRTKKIM
jgi:ankyrin repeat protein